VKWLPNGNEYMSCMKTNAWALSHIMPVELSLANVIRGMIWNIGGYRSGMTRPSRSGFSMA
jgi:hypothetical protein